MAPTRFGMSVFGAARGRARFDAMAGLAARAESVGMDSVWTNELYSHSATVGMAVLADRTARVAIGSGIAYGVGRTPLIWVAEARDLDELSEGRMIVGLGNGTARMMEDWHGVSGEAPAVRMEELVDVMRKLWRLHEGPVKHEGRFYRVDIRPTAATPPPFREHLPIYVAGVNDRMVEAAGRVADGLVGHPMFTARYVDDVVRPAIEKGARKRDRDPAHIEIVRQFICSTDEDVDVARSRLAFAVAQYATSRIYVRLFEMYGWGREREAIAEAVRGGDHAAIVDAVPDAVLDEIGVACRPDELADALDRDWSGAEHVVLVPPPWGLSGEQIETQMSASLDAFERLARRDDADVRQPHS
jgi:probable F420-dependent oxidoreductase